MTTPWNLRKPGELARKRRDARADQQHWPEAERRFVEALEIYDSLSIDAEVEECCRRVGSQ